MPTLIPGEVWVDDFGRIPCSADSDDINSEARATAWRIVCAGNRSGPGSTGRTLKAAQFHDHLRRVRLLTSWTRANFPQSMTLRVCLLLRGLLVSRAGPAGTSAASEFCCSPGRDSAAATSS
jgi:hypothetical protein